MGLEDDLVLKIFAFIPLLRQISGSSSECIRLSTCFAWPIHNLEVKPGQKLGPMCLTMIQELG